MLSNKDKFIRRKQRTRARIRKESDLSRLSVFKSNSHIHVQLFDDKNGITLVSVSTQQKEFEKLANKSNVAAAKLVGAAIGKKALDKGIKKVVFDKGGNLYHGVVKAVADSAREVGLEL